MIEVYIRGQTFTTNNFFRIGLPHYESMMRIIKGRHAATGSGGGTAGTGTDGGWTGTGTGTTGDLTVTAAATPSTLADIRAATCHLSDHTSILHLHTETVDDGAA